MRCMGCRDVEVFVLVCGYMFVGFGVLVVYVGVLKDLCEGFYWMLRYLYWFMDDVCLFYWLLMLVSFCADVRMVYFRFRVLGFGLSTVDCLS